MSVGGGTIAIVSRRRINCQFAVLVLIAALGAGCVRRTTTATPIVSTTTPSTSANATSTSSTTPTTLSETQRPAIEILAPASGADVRSPARITGTADTFEATFRVSVVDDNDKVLADQMVMATSGSGTRGTFSTTVQFSVDHAGAGKVVAYEESAKDGSHIHVVEVPVRLATG